MATNSRPVAILLCGKSPAHISTVSEALQPPFTIIKSCSTKDQAIEYLSTRPLPVRAVIMGAGFSVDDFNAVRNTPGAKGIPWLRPAHTNPDGKTPPPLGPPPPGEVVERVVRCLDGKEGLFAEDGSVTGWQEAEIWYF